MVKIKTWSEEFEPKNFNKGEYLGLEHNRIAFDNIIKNQQKPNNHLLFHGIHGTGKTSASKIISNILCGSMNNQLIMNASDNRKMEDVRNTIKPFARQIVHNGYNMITLDEVDSTKIDYQNALRRIMEKWNKDTRFILCCNNQDKIIPPVQSRCDIYYFPRINTLQIIKRLKYIRNIKKSSITNEVIDKIAYYFNGDVRKCINTLQTIHFGTPLEALIIDTDPNEFIKVIRNNDLNEIKDYIETYIHDTELFKRLLLSVYRLIITHDKISEKGKRTFLRNLGEADFRVSMNTSPELEMARLCILLNDDL